MAFLVKHLTHAFVPLGEAIPADFSYSLLLTEPSTVQYQLEVMVSNF